MLPHRESLGTMLPHRESLGTMLPTTGIETHREKHVFLVLVDGLGVWNGVCVFEDAHTLPCQDGLVNLQCCREDLCHSDISRNLVTNCERMSGVSIAHNLSLQITKFICPRPT